MAASYNIILIFVLNFLDIGECKNALDPHFSSFIKKYYKPSDYNLFVRDELTLGSFGGGVYEGNVRPVVFIHGLNNEAGDLWKVRADFVAHGHPVQQTFATTWGKGAETMNLNVRMSCEYILQIRRFIELVRWYTGFDQVDVVAYSMGSPMARKAILGGKCVDNEAIDLGAPLTKMIHTYVSVAGANQGSHLCGLPFFDICNFNNGLVCGSKFLTDINSKQNYEATFRSYNLASTSDQVVGYFTCGKKASEFAGAHEWKIDNHYHVQTEYDTGSIQVKMVREGGYAERNRG